MSQPRNNGELTGTVEIVEVPPFFGYSMTLSLFAVTSSDAPAPFSEVAPAEARKDTAELSKTIHFDHKDATGNLIVPFLLRRPAGWYYVQLNVILYRKRKEEMYAQVERFPFLKRPVEIPQGGQRIVLPITWPSTPIEELEHYGTMKPGGSGKLY